MAVAPRKTIVMVVISSVVGARAPAFVISGSG
jgi:hypothetical protein